MTLILKTIRYPSRPVIGRAGNINPASAADAEGNNLAPSVSDSRRCCTDHLIQGTFPREEPSVYHGKDTRAEVSYAASEHERRDNPGAELPETY